MKIKVKLGCSICGYSQLEKIELPIDCDELICPKCKESNCLSIISIIDDSKVADINHKYEPLLSGLYKIRLL